MSGSDSEQDVVNETTSGERPNEKYVRFEAVSKAKKAQWSLSKNRQAMLRNSSVNLSGFHFIRGHH